MNNISLSDQKANSLNAEGTPKQPKLFCLLPVRNGAEFLPGYFECVRQFADGIIALDDGSTDETLRLLEGEPLVRCVLTNPRRATFAGWNDAENRQRLLSACTSFLPQWVLWLDVDELVAKYDVPLLSRLISELAVPGHAYGFEVLRMIDDLQHFDRHRLWVYRLYTYRLGLNLPRAKLHFAPVPDEIIKKCWHRTIIRILHQSSMTAQRRRTRFRKYKEADPARIWQDSYASLLDPPGHLWQLRAHLEDVEILIDMASA